MSPHMQSCREETSLCALQLCAVSGPPPINLRWNPHVGDRGHAQWEGEGVHEAHARSRHASWRPTM